MTWTTVNPLGPSQPVTLALFAVTAMTLAYAFGLLYRMLQMRRPGRILVEDLEEGHEEDEET